MSSYGAVSTTTWTVPDGKMAEFMAWAMTYDISVHGKGCLRIISMETDANTVICVSLYDTLENCTARIGSEARAAMMKTVADLGVTGASERGAIVAALAGAVPRVASNNRVGSYRKYKIKAGQMDAAIALLATPNPEPVIAGRRGGFAVKIDDTTLITHTAYNDQASMDAGAVKGPLPHLDPAEIAEVLEGPGTRMTGLVISDLYATRAAAAMSTHFITVAPGKMDAALAWSAAYDVRAAPGRFRMSVMQVDENTLVSVSLYDTVESLKARHTSPEADASGKALAAFATNVERVEGPTVFAQAATPPRTYSDSKVASTRKMKILPGKVDEVIALLKATAPVPIPGHRGAVVLKIDENTLLMHSVYNDQASLDASAENSKKVSATFAPFLAESGARIIGKYVLDVWA